MSHSQLLCTTDNPFVPISVATDECISSIPFGPPPSLPRRTFLVTSPVRHLASCGARGIVGVQEESGKVHLYDMEDDDDDDGEEEEEEEEEEGGGEMHTD